MLLGLLALCLAAPDTMVCAAGDFQPLIGRWQRTDGGYIIEIRSIAPDGTMAAGYYNPQPINVSRAQVFIFKDYTKIEVELRDQGYPGSFYTLTYSPDKDVFFGYYYHAVSAQYFDVLFVRMK
ncbi:MAG: hypothetical protein WBI57_14545 [Desulfobacterales bacterium]